MALSSAVVNDQREIFGWAMYDWGQFGLVNQIFGSHHPAILSLIFIVGQMLLPLVRENKAMEDAQRYSIAHA